MEADAKVIVFLLAIIAIVPNIENQTSQIISIITSKNKCHNINWYNTTNHYIHFRLLKQLKITPIGKDKIIAKEIILPKVKIKTLIGVIA